MFKGLRGDNLTDKLNLLSLMLALFCGTASLPHILIRYYTVKANGFGYWQRHQRRRAAAQDRPQAAPALRLSGTTPRRTGPCDLG